MVINVTLDAIGTPQEDMSFVGVEIDEAQKNRAADILLQTAEEFLAEDGQEMRLTCPELGVSLDFQCAPDNILTLFEALGGALAPFRTDL